MALEASLRSFKEIKLLDWRVVEALFAHHSTNSLHSMLPEWSLSSSYMAAFNSLSVKSAPSVEISWRSSCLSMAPLLSRSNCMNWYLANASICFAGLGLCPTRFNHQTSHSSTLNVPVPSVSMSARASSSSFSTGSPKLRINTRNSSKFNSLSPLSASLYATNAILACSLNSVSVARLTVRLNCVRTSWS